MSDLCLCPEELRHQPEELQDFQNPVEWDVFSNIALDGKTNFLYPSPPNTLRDVQSSACLILWSFIRSSSTNLCPFFTSHVSLTPQHGRSSTLIIYCSWISMTTHHPNGKNPTNHVSMNHSSLLKSSISMFHRLPVGSTGFFRFPHASSPLLLSF